MTSGVTLQKERRALGPPAQHRDGAAPPPAQLICKCIHSHNHQRPLPSGTVVIHPEALW